VGFRLSELTAMEPEALDAAFQSLTTPSTAGRRSVESEVRALEQRYEMSSAAMLASGIDTADTARWRVLLRALVPRPGR
jgi:hypothetical protein